MTGRRARGDAGSFENCVVFRHDAPGVRAAARAHTAVPAEDFIRANLSAVRIPERSSALTRNDPRLLCIRDPG